MEQNSEIIIYTASDGTTKLQVQLEDETVWLTQDQMAMLFGKGRTTITEHIGNIFKEGELNEKEVCRLFRHTTKHGAIEGKTQKECPPPDESQRKKKRGRLKRSKARNLLERLMDYENETLRFMDDKIVPFTNNQGEKDIRMTKVQQKISGCFRSMKGAAIFCRVRSYLSTCKKHGVRASEAPRLLFEGKLPEFLNE